MLCSLWRLPHNWYCFSTADCFLRATRAFSHVLLRPQEMLTDESRDNMHSRANTSKRAHSFTYTTRLSLPLPGVSEKNMLSSSACFDWSQAKLFFFFFPFLSATAAFPPTLQHHPSNPIQFFFPLSSFPKWMSSSIPTLPPPQLASVTPGQTSAKAPRFCLFKYLICKQS